MFTVTIETAFDARHQLTLADGTKELLHNHHWVVRAAVSAEHLDEAGLVVDFNYLKAKLDEVTAPLRDAQLEELECFGDMNASAENVARYIYDRIEPLLGPDVKLVYVEVAEAPLCRAKFEK